MDSYKLKDVGNEAKDMGYTNAPENGQMYSNSFLDKPPIKDKPSR